MVSRSQPFIDGIRHDFCFACLDGTTTTISTISTVTIYDSMIIYDHEHAAGRTLLSLSLPSPCRCRPHQMLLPVVLQLLPVVLLAIQACRSCVLSLHESQSSLVSRTGTHSASTTGRDSAARCCKFSSLTRHLAHLFVQTKRTGEALCFAVALAEAEPRP